MARLQEVRHSIVSSLDQETSAIDAEEVDAADADVVDWGTDEEDFAEALGLMWDTVKLLKAILGRCKLSSMSRHLIERHRDDLMQFMSEFPAEKT